MKRLATIFFVGIGGMVGAVLRYIISLRVSSMDSIHFPWDTLTINLGGAFLLSFLLFSVYLTHKIPSHLFTGITTGLLGAFTTFSTFSVDSVLLLQSNLGIAAIYVSLTIFGGISFNILGYLLAKKLSTKRVSSHD